jgi:hypothetical protein
MRDEASQRTGTQAWLSAAGMKREKATGKQETKFHLG